MSLFGFGSTGGPLEPVSIQGDDSVLTPLITELGWFDVVDSDTAALARGAATKAGRALGLEDSCVCDLGIAVAELADNLYEHAGGGRVAIRVVRRSGVSGIEIVVVDCGPGMPGFPWELHQGGNLATAVRRASRYDGYSLSGRGTVISIQFWPSGVYPTEQTATGLTRPMPGESVSGDQFAIVLREDGPILMVVDGLGHGPLAAEAASAAVDAFHLAVGVTKGNPGDLVEEIHRAVARTRGAAVAIAKLEPAAGQIRFAGLGNIAAAIVATPGNADSGRTGMVSQQGIVGHQRGELRESCYPLNPTDLVVLHSDGVTDRWDLGAYPDLAGHEPLVVATTLLRDAGVRRDDACVLVAKSW